jgi:hypothetical protein
MEIMWNLDRLWSSVVCSRHNIIRVLSLACVYGGGVGNCKHMINCKHTVNIPKGLCTMTILEGARPWNRQWVRIESLPGFPAIRNTLMTLQKLWGGMEAITGWSVQNCKQTVYCLLTVCLQFCHTVCIGLYNGIIYNATCTDIFTIIFSVSTATRTCHKRGRCYGLIFTKPPTYFLCPFRKPSRNPRQTLF